MSSWFMFQLTLLGVLYSGRGGTTGVPPDASGGLASGLSL